MSVELSEEDFLLATETALGVLDPADDARMRARMENDRAFASAVENAEARLTLLYAGQERDPPPGAWEGIKRRIAPTPKRNSLFLWKAAAGVSTTLAAILAIALIAQPEPVPPAAPLVAALGQAGSKPALAASFDRGTGLLTITPVAIDIGQSYPQLWIIPEAGVPHPLGMIDRERPSQIVLTPALRALMARGATLAISSEPQGGSKTGAPTGPVIASGKIDAI